MTADALSNSLLSLLSVYVCLSSFFSMFIIGQMTRYYTTFVWQMHAQLTSVTRSVIIFFSPLFSYSFSQEDNSLGSEYTSTAPKEQPATPSSAPKETDKTSLTSAAAPEPISAPAPTLAPPPTDKPAE